MTAGGPLADAHERPGSPTLAAYRQARAALDDAVEAAGGAARLRAIRTVLVERRGHLHMRNQSPRPEGPYLELGRTGRLALDLVGGRAVFERVGEFAGGYVDALRTVLAPEGGCELDLHLRTVRPYPGLGPAHFEWVHRIVPPLLLRRALERRSTLRPLGTTERDGAPCDAVGFAWSDGSAFTLHLDAATRMVRSYELLATDRLAGDSAVEFAFSGWRREAGVAVPGRLVHRAAGETTAVFDNERVAVDEPLARELFAVPEGFETCAPAPAGPARHRPLGDGVWLLEGLGGRMAYNALVVVLRHGVLVAEAPLSSAVGEEVLGHVRELAPGRPVRWLVLTHHHDDHSAGMRPFVAEGATLVTTEGNRDFFARMAAAPRTLEPDRQAEARRPVDFDFVRRRWSVSDGERTVEVHDVGATRAGRSPHVDEMLLVHLPGERLVFEGDLLNVPRDGPIAPASDTTVHFARVLDELGLAAETIAGVHGTVGSRADLDRALALRGPA